MSAKSLFLTWWNIFLALSYVIKSDVLIISPDDIVNCIDTENRLNFKIRRKPYEHMKHYTYAMW